MKKVVFLIVMLMITNIAIASDMSNVLAQRQRALDIQAGQDLAKAKQKAEKRIIKVGDNSGEVRYVITTSEGEEVILPGRIQFNVQSIEKSIEQVDKNLNVLQDENAIATEIQRLKDLKQEFLNMKAILNE